MDKAFRVFWITILLLSIPFISFAATYYVKNGGDDTKDGLSDANAWAYHPWQNGAASVSLGTALSAGDAVYLNKGDTWSGSNALVTTDEGGSDGSPIVFGAYGTGVDPILDFDGNNNAGYGAFYIDKSWITVENIYLTNAGTKELMEIGGSASPTNCEGIIIDDCEFYYVDASGQMGIDVRNLGGVGNTTNITIQNCTLHSLAEQGYGWNAIRIHGGVTECKVIDNDFHDWEHHGIDVIWDGTDECEDIEIYGNTFVDINDQAIYLTAVKRAVVCDNDISDMEAVTGENKMGVWVTEGSIAGAHVTEEVIVRHNRIWDIENGNGNYGVAFWMSYLDDSGCLDNIYWYNNTIYSNGRVRYFVPTCPNYTWVNNLCYLNDTDSYVCAPGVVDDDYGSDPKFVDPANDDFTLQSTSPCIDAGSPQTLANGSGSDNISLIVDNTTFWPGDQIIIDGTTIRTISSINRSTKTLTLSSVATWSDNDEVALYKSFHDSTTILYYGSGVDLGAHEYWLGTGIPGPGCAGTFILENAEIH